jgi:type I restriction-modification system specificity protein
MEEWKEYKLGDVLTIKYGKDHKQLADGDIPIYGSGGIMRYGERSLYDGPSILIPRKGSLNNVIYADKPFWTVDTMFWSIINDSIANPLFVYYSICKKDFASLNVGSAVPSLTVPVIEDIDILLPSKATQDKVVSVLKSLDDKIELNRHINDNLEQQAQALFKSWFVDFEPFKKGKFIDSELGMIPEGWQVEELGNITNSITEKVGKRTDIKVLSPVNTGDLLLSEEYFTKQVYSKNLAKYIMVAPNDFAYNPARINIGSIGMNTFDFSGCVSPVYIVFRCEKEYHHFFNIFKATKNFKEEVNTRAIGGVRQTLSYKDFSLIKIVYPPKEVVERFNKIYRRIMTLIKKNVLENKRLHQTRDTLLPKLMSGELKINDINN